MEQKITAILRLMQRSLDEEQLRELKDVLQMTFAGCDIVENSSLRVISDGWKDSLEDFLISKALGGLSTETVERYRYELNRLLSYINKPVQNIMPGDISNYMRMYKHIRSVSNQTLKNVRAVYSSFFSWLRDYGRIVKNPMIMVEGIKVKTVVKKAFSDEDREKIFRSCENIRDKAMIEFLYSTAVRVSELKRLIKDDIHFADKTLIVYGKGAKERSVYINERTNMYLQEYLSNRTDDNPALFVSLKSPHKRLSKSGIENIVKRIGEAAEVKKVHPHRFRGTAITNALNRGMPLQEASLFAGHAKPETTMRYWTADRDAVQYHHKKYLSA